MLLPQLSYSDLISVTLDLEDTDTTVCASMLGWNAWEAWRLKRQRDRGSTLVKDIWWRSSDRIHYLAISPAGGLSQESPFASSGPPPRGKIMQLGSRSTPIQCRIMQLGSASTRNKMQNSATSLVGMHPALKSIHQRQCPNILTIGNILCETDRYDKIHGRRTKAVNHHSR